MTGSQDKVIQKQNLAGRLAKAAGAFLEDDHDLVPWPTQNRLRNELIDALSEYEASQSSSESRQQ